VRAPGAPDSDQIRSGDRAASTIRDRAQEFHHSPRRWRDGGQCVDDTLAMLVVTRALVASYPSWTDEHGTNVEQLAAIAVTALEAQGLLAEPKTSLDPIHH
jgi:hypothetical protein